MSVGLEPPDNAALDLVSVQAWQDFLVWYAAGKNITDSAPPVPPIPGNLIKSHPPIGVSKPWAFANAPLYGASGITIDDARAIRGYYCENNYLPPPRSPQEPKRHACINDYDLYSPKQVKNVQNATDLIAAFFPNTICTFSLFHDHIQKHFTISGNEELIRSYQLVPGLRIPAEDSLCGHAVLHSDSIFFIQDLRNDWRYANNPFVAAGFQSFVGSAVSLRLNPLAEDEADTRIVIGTLNICFIREPIIELSTTQRNVIAHVTAMLETQLRATWEGDQRTKEGRARLALADLIQDVLVDKKGEELALQPIANAALAKLHQVLPDIDSLVVWDIGSVLDATDIHIADVGLSAEVVGAAGQALPVVPQQVILDCMNRFLSATVFRDQGGSSLSGLEEYLPSSSKSHLVLPLQSGERPFYLMLAASNAAHYSFPTVDVNIMRSMASIVRAKAVQRRVLLADAAKTSFLSSISHELRTPMHGVKASIELIRQAAEARDWTQVWGPLDLAESSGRTLMNILNDVLDFGRNKSRTAVDTTVDLAKSAQEIVSVCLADHGTHLGENATMSLEYEERDWRVQVDEARFQRILMNGLTNALKFCTNGAILLSISTTSVGEGVTITVSDHGIGIDAEVLPRLLQPFSKADANSPGAGLGLYITKQIVEEMGGEFSLRSVEGQGTIFSATIPLKIGPQSSGTVAVTRREFRKTRAARESLIGESPKRLTVTPPPAPVIRHNNGEPAQAIIPEPGATSLDPPVRVLVIDDNTLCRRVLRMALRRARVSNLIKEAENGQVGVELYESFRPDLVLTDVSMPVMDGVTAACRMREITTDVPCRIYAITGLGSSDPRTQSIAVNGKAALDGWLIKGKDMLDTVYKILDEVQANRRLAA